MENTPRGSRLHIAIFGRRNAGKSSLINALTNQEIALVSAVPGTTTDPVYKAMEILPLGPVVLIDTAGLDDEGELGRLRVERSIAVLAKADLVILALDGADNPGEFEEEIYRHCRQKNVPVVGVLTKADVNGAVDETKKAFADMLDQEPLEVSAANGKGIAELKIALIRAAPPTWDERTIVGDLLQPEDTVVLVTPIDNAAPKGRLILPQVQTMRDLLDHEAVTMVVKEAQLKEALGQLKNKPKMVITDSQAFAQVGEDTPVNVLLTSFSILFARYKGDLQALVEGAKAIDSLKSGDRVLIAEACTHHSVDDDIGRVKIPAWLNKRVGGQLQFVWCSGQGFAKDLSTFKLVIHCGGCMMNRREMLSRITQAQDAGVSIVNYGVAIAHFLGILPRALSPFPAIQELLLAEDEKKGLSNDGE